MQFAIAFIIAIVLATSAVNGQRLPECKKDKAGVDYTGTISKTKSGIECQAWNSGTPHPNRYKSTPEKFPEGSVDEAKNYCRNPDKDSKGPWCFTMSNTVDWEYCDIPFCIEGDPTCATDNPCMNGGTCVDLDGSAGISCNCPPGWNGPTCNIECWTDHGRNYMGTMSQTAAGQQCISWSSAYAVEKIRRYLDNAGAVFSDGSTDAASNYCRNPDGDSKPWCYTDVDGHYGYCAINICGEGEAVKRK